MSNPPPLIRTVTLSLARPLADKALEGLSFPEGLTDLRIISPGRRIVLSYDLRRISLTVIESWLASVGAPLSSNLLARWYRQWLAFKDENRLDQARIVHQCCNVPPKGK